MQIKKNKLTLLLVFCLTVFFSIGAFSQANAPAATSTAGNTASQDGNTYDPRFDYGQLQREPQIANKKSYEQSLYRVSLDTFEEGGNWAATMPFDYGRAVLAMKRGVPEGVKNAPAEVTQLSGQDGSANANAVSDANPSGYFVSKPDTKTTVLGAKVNFYPGRRVAPWVRIDAVQPIAMDGMVRGFEVWTSGRELKHDLFIVVEDVYGKEQLVPMGSLNFLGWRKMTAQVPSYVVQQDPHELDRRGLIFKGFYIKFRMLDAMGTYFIYFDNLAAEVSRYVEENQIKDDIRDNW